MHNYFPRQAFSLKFMARGLRHGAGAAAIFFPLALLHAAEGGGVDNLAFTVGATTYSIPHLEIQGASLPPAELAHLFDGDEKAIDARLARFSARKIVIPALASETRTVGSVERGAYRDLVFENISAGRVGLARAAGGAQTVEKAQGVAERYVWGAVASRGVDLRQLVHISLASRGDADEAKKPLVEEEIVESATFEDRNENLVVKTGRLTLAGVRGRALAAPPVRLLERLEKLDPEKPEDDAALLRDLLDAVASLDVAALDARDIVATGKGAPADKPYTVRIGRAFAKDIAAAAIGDFAIEDFSLASSDGGKATLARFGLRGAQLASLLDSGYPRLAHIEAKGLEADLPDPKTDEAARMKFSLAGAEADFSNYRDIAPTKISARIDRFAVDLATRGEAPSTAQFVALGYKSLDLSAALAGEWREKTREAVVAPLRIEGRDMGAATLDVTFGNVSEAVFSPVALLSRAAALAASVKSVDLTLEGGGLLDRVLALEAKEQKIPLEKARTDYAKAAGGAIVELAGGGEKAKRIADAVSAFIMKPKRLHLRVASQQGVNALDTLAKKPADILESVEVEARADK